MIAGAQGYNLRMFAQTPRDIRRSLEAVAKMGYAAVQISAFGSIDAKELRTICDGCGLEIALTHVPEQRLLNDLDAVLHEHEIMGCDFVGLGAMPERYRAGGAAWLPHFFEDFDPVTRQIAKAGKRFMYHNHHFEFERLADGRTMMEHMLSAFPAEQMGITLDTYWLQAAGCDILAWVELLKDRIPCVHYKDMAVVHGQVRMAPVGEGNIPFAAVTRKLTELSCTQYVFAEQDDSYERSPFECLVSSRAGLKALGI